MIDPVVAMRRRNKDWGAYVLIQPTKLQDPAMYVDETHAPSLLLYIQSSAISLGRS